MPECAMRSCGKSTINSNYQKDGISFHRFPKCQKMKQKWIEATCRDGWSPTNESVICSKHFGEDDFQVMKNRCRLRDSSVPTLNLPLVFSMDGSLRDFVIAEYKKKMLENNKNPPTSLAAAAPDASDIKNEINETEIGVKDKETKSMKRKRHTFSITNGSTMKITQLLANDELRRKKRRR